MKYCIFENTLGDLQTCLEKLEEFYSLDLARYRLKKDSMSHEEEEAMQKLIELCEEISDRYGEK